MKQLLFLLLLPVMTAHAADPALTIYNQNFGVVRETITLDLQQGVTDVRFSDATMLLEPDSVILRDRTGTTEIQILEQNYRAEPISESLLLSMFEGKTIDFQVRYPESTKIVQGKVVRSGHQPQIMAAHQQHGIYPPQGQSQPIIEVDGKLQFSLPGQPLFPSLGDDTILKPTLNWKIQSTAAATVNAELAYVTGGMSWKADYNIVSPEKGDLIDLVGWITMSNTSGRVFENASIKLMAGDVNKIVPPTASAPETRAAFGIIDQEQAAVTEKSFDEFHLYTLARPTTLRDQETKQVEFVRATGIQSRRIYVYDGAELAQFRGWNMQMIRDNPDYGTLSNPKVWVMREFENSEPNKLGIPLPKGRLRFYRQDDDQRLEFTGENEIDHTPRDETVRVYTGNAFDLVGERKRLDYRMNSDAKWVDEIFEIKVRNRKKEPLEIRLVEHLYRWVNWEIREPTHDFEKTDAQTIEFRVPLAEGEEKTIRYTVHYSW